MTSTCVVVMGVSGAGKSTVADLLGQRLEWTVAEADEFHPESNVEKMASGVPLTDSDRLPWLSAMRDWITRHSADETNTIVTCSALKRSYRDHLRDTPALVRFLCLSGTSDVIGSRLGERSGHFMPASLLDSQLSAFEPLLPDENGVTVDVTRPPEEITRTAVTALGLDARTAAC
ncbi:gluconokinase [Actinopolyspora halophila]|uniref:gluconokinase n=1 Tax=Actinopolyspora halophila TaxID=1850 RepID=UPI0003723C9F|nr:gluconokinase [Actinopolyspora halophila]